MGRSSYSAGKRAREAEKARKKRDKSDRRRRNREGATTDGEIRIATADEIQGGDLRTPEEVVRATIASRLPDDDPGERHARALRHQTAASLETVADEFIEIYARAVGREHDVVDLREPEDENQASTPLS